MGKDDQLANTAAPDDLDIPDEIIQAVGEAMEDWAFKMLGSVTTHRPGIARGGEEARKVIKAAYPSIRRMLGYEAVYDLGIAQGRAAALEELAERKDTRP